MKFPHRWDPKRWICQSSSLTLRSWLKILSGTPPLRNNKKFQQLAPHIFLRFKITSAPQLYINRSFFMSNSTTPFIAPVAAPSTATFLDGGYIFNSAISLLLVQIIIITTLSRGLGFAIGKIKEPMVVAEMLAGIILGPTVLGRIPGFSDTLFPKSSQPLLGIVANLGLILFMFVVGLEIDFKEFKYQAKSSLVASVCGVIVPFVCAVPLIFLLYTPDLVDQNVSIGVFYLFLSVVMGISALPVLARILSEYHFLGSPIGVFTMSATAFDDLLAWPLLALAIALSEATNAISILYIFICMGGLAVLLIFPVRLFFNWLARRIRHRESLSQFVLLIILIVAFTIAWFCEVIGLTGLIGAFSVGLFVPRENNIPSQISERIEDLIVIVFMPLYFTLSGLKTQFALLDNGTLWGYTILIIFVTLISKIVGCSIPTRFMGKFSWTESLIFGVLMNTKGLVALISLNLGLDSGLISQKFFAMLIIMVLVNTMIPCPTVALIYRISKKKSPEQLEQEKNEGSTFKVMAAINHHISAPYMVSLAKTLSLKQKPLELTFIRLLESSSRPSEIMAGWSKKSERKDDVIICATQRAKLLNVNVKETLYYMSNDIGHDICKDSRNKEVDLLIVGCHHKRIRGETVQKVIEGSAVSTAFLLGKQENLELTSNILFLYRESEHDILALKLAMTIAESQNQRLTILHITTPKKRENQAFLNMLLQKTYIDYKLVETESKYKTALTQELNSMQYSFVVLGLSSKIARRVQVINENLPIMAVMDVEVMLRQKMEQMGEEHRDLIRSGDGSRSNEEVSINISNSFRERFE